MSGKDDVSQEEARLAHVPACWSIAMRSPTFRASGGVFGSTC